MPATNEAVVDIFLQHLSRTHHIIFAEIFINMEKKKLSLVLLLISKSYKQL